MSLHLERAWRGRNTEVTKVMTKAPAHGVRPPLYPSKEGNLLLRQLDGCGGLPVRATSHPLTTRDQQGRQQADTPLLGCKVGLESNGPSALYTCVSRKVTWA
jgi:hypothetical protein